MAVVTHRRPRQTSRTRTTPASAVKQYAVAQPEKMKAPEFLEELRNLKADLQIVVVRMMPEVVWPMGTMNVHGSLLPQYRGAAPINRPS